MCSHFLLDPYPPHSHSPLAFHVQSAVSSPWTALICHALNPTPKSSPLMRSYLDPYLPACSRGGVDVICLSAHSYFRTHLHHNIPHTSTSTTAHTYSIFIFSLTPYSGLGTFIAYANHIVSGKWLSTFEWFLSSISSMPERRNG